MEPDYDLADLDQDELGDLRAKLSDLQEALPLAVAAAAASARLDEASRRPAVPRTRHVRLEALALSSREGLGCDEIRLLIHLAGTGDEVMSKVERAAADLMRALAKADDLVPGRVEPIDLVELWTLSDGWNQRAAGADGDYELRLDRDAEIAARLLGALADAPSPIEGAALIARIVRDGLFGNPDRMACLLAPAILRTGLSAPGARIGVARHLPGPDRLRALPPEAAVRAVLVAAREGAEAALSDLAADRALRDDLGHRIAGERAGARTARGIEAFAEVPVRSLGDLSARLGLTARGADMMVKRLAAAGIVRPHRGNRSKGRLFVCDRALGRPA